MDRCARRSGDEHRMLVLERALERGPRLAARDISREIRKFGKEARSGRPPKHVDHQQVAGAELATEPVALAEPLRDLREPVADAIVEDRQGLPGPALFLFHQDEMLALHDRAP